MALVAGKIKNMAEENVEDVFLTPDDIPGAAVKNKEIGKLTVNQLKNVEELTKVETNRLSMKGYILVVLAVVFFVVAFVFAIFVIPVRFPHFLQGKNSQFHARN